MFCFKFNQVCLSNSWATLIDSYKNSHTTCSVSEWYPVVCLTKHFWSFEPDLELVFKIWIQLFILIYYFLLTHCSSILFLAIIHSARSCLPVAMSTRRRPPPDLPTLKRSRSSFTGAITRARDKLLPMRDARADTCSAKTIERLLCSVANTEKGFMLTLEEAQEFIAVEENQEALLKEEDDALENFTEAISDVRDMVNSLLSLKSIKKQLHNLQRDLRGL